MEADSGGGVDVDALAKCVNAHGTELLQRLLRAAEKDRGLRKICDRLMASPKLNYASMNAAAAAGSSLPAEGRAGVQSLIVRNVRRLFPAQRSEREEEGLGEPPSSMPGLECFLDLPREREAEKTFADLREGDVVISKLRSSDESGIIAKLLCTTGHRFRRDLDSLNIDVFVTRDELAAEDDGLRQRLLNPQFDPALPYHNSKYFAAEVGSVARDARKLSVRIASAAKSSGLGPMPEDAMPAFYHRVRQLGPDESYDRAFRHSRDFRNPGFHASLVQSLGLNPRMSREYVRQSFLPEMKDPGDRFQAATFVDALRKRQNRAMANKSVEKGVERLKKGALPEALELFNKAVEIDPEHVEAYVARGALNGNKSKYDEAVVDLEKALSLKPHHTNARQYLLQVLMEKGKLHEGRRKPRHDSHAIRCYQRVLSLDPRQTEAKTRLTRLDPSGASLVLPHIQACIIEWAVREEEVVGAVGKR